MRKKAPKRIRLNAEVQRERILTSATEILAREGFFNLSYQKIADDLKVSQSAVLYHFTTKEGLIEGVIQKIVEHNHAIVSAALKSEDDGVARLRKHFEMNLTWAQKNPKEAQIIILLYYFACSSDSFSDLYSRILESARNRIADYLHAGQREGLIAKSVSPRPTAETLHDALLGGIINAITGPSRLPKTGEIRKRWEILFRSHLQLGKNGK